VAVFGVVAECFQRVDVKMVGLVECKEVVGGLGGPKLRPGLELLALLVDLD